MSVPTQVAQQWWLRLRYGIRPSTYYQLQLFDPGRRRAAWAFLDPSQHAVLVGNVLRRRADADVTTLQDKATFATWCAQHDLPTAAIIATVAPDADADAAVPALPPVDLFSKPADAGQGVGVCHWRHVRTADGVDRWRDASEIFAADAVDAVGLCTALRSARHRGTYVIQRRLVNHPTVADLTPGGLCTARVVTMRDGAGMSVLRVV